MILLKEFAVIFGEAEKLVVDKVIRHFVFLNEHIIDAAQPRVAFIIRVIVIGVAERDAVLLRVFEVWGDPMVAGGNDTAVREGDGAAIAKQRKSWVYVDAFSPGVSLVRRLVEHQGSGFQPEQRCPAAFNLLATLSPQGNWRFSGLAIFRADAKNDRRIAVAERYEDTVIF